MRRRHENNHQKPWFGKRTIGWGLNSITWQGWLVTTIFSIVVILDFSYLKMNTTRILIFILALIIFIIIAILTGEKPGSKQFSE